MFTDGSCIGNPGWGGWACLLRWGSVERTLSGVEQNTTNNRMELRAVISGLAALRESCAVEVVTDSQYVYQGMTRYLSRWCSSEWVNSRGEPISNRDLWEELSRESRKHTVEWTWVRGHANCPDQNRCDRLAQAAARSAAAAA